MNNQYFEKFYSGALCFYCFFDSENKSKALVEIVRVLDDPRGVAEVKFRRVFVDDTGNGFFDYLYRTGGMMKVSLKYLYPL